MREWDDEERKKKKKVKIKIEATVSKWEVFSWRNADDLGLSQSKYKDALNENLFLKMRKKKIYITSAHIALERNFFRAKKKNEKKIKEKPFDLTSSSSSFTLLIYRQIWNWNDIAPSVVSIWK